MKHPKIDNFLKQIGFSSVEIQIFIALLGNDGSTVMSLSKETGIPRSTVHVNIEKLKKKGIVYEANNSSKRKLHTRKENLADILKKRRLLIDEEEKTLNSLEKQFEDVILEIDQKQQDSNTLELKDTLIQLEHDEFLVDFDKLRFEVMQILVHFYTILIALGTGVMIISIIEAGRVLAGTLVIYLLAIATVLLIRYRFLYTWSFERSFFLLTLPFLLTPLYLYLIIGTAMTTLGGVISMVVIISAYLILKAKQAFMYVLFFLVAMTVIILAHDFEIIPNYYEQYYSSTTIKVPDTDYITMIAIFIFMLLGAAILRVWNREWKRLYDKSTTYSKTIENLIKKARE